LFPASGADAVSRRLRCGFTLACVLPSQDGTQSEKETIMSSATADKVKGRVKEAAGALTDDEELKDEGKLDQAAGKVKEKASKIVDKVRDAVTKH
jgi:uncharacterized protein YjbJ (UPF0337 family)